MLLTNAPKLFYSAAVNASVQSVTKVDDYTVTIAFRTANPRFHLSSSFPAVWTGFFLSAKHVWEGKDPLTFQEYPPVGTGPYKLVTPPTETTMVWERRDDWWATEVFGVRPAPKRIIYTWPGPAETKAMKMASHELDGVWQLLPGLIDRVRTTTPTVRSWSITPPYGFPGLCPRHLYLNMLKYPWSLPEVRRAVSYLIDRKELADVTLEGGVYPAWGPFSDSAALKPYFDAIQDLLVKYEPTAFNVTKSEEIFRNLGFNKGADGIWVTPNGTRLELTIITRSWDPDSVAMGPVVASRLSDGGIDAVAKPTDSAPYSELLATGRYDGCLMVTCPGDTDVLAVLDLFHSRFFVPIGQWASYDQVRYENPEYDAIVDELRVTSPDDLAKCTDLFRKAMEIYFRDVVTIPKVHAPDGMAVYDYYYWIGWPNKEDPYNQPWPHNPVFHITVTGYPSPLAGGEWVKGIRPASVDYEIVYFTKATPKFRGIDLTWYGPFKAGDSKRIPADDAEFWIRKDYASYSAPVPGLSPELAEAIRSLNTTVVATRESLLREVRGLSGQMATLSIAAAVEGIAVIVLAAVLVLIIRRKPT